MKAITISLIIYFLLLGLCFAHKEIIYNKDKGYYAVWEKEKKALVKIINNNCAYNNLKKREILTFPYQQGFPALLPYGMEEPMNISDLDKDSKQELAFMTMIDGKMHLYSYLGLPKQGWIDPLLFWIATFGDINADGYLDIIGCHGEYGLMLGAAAREINSEMINGFPNPPKTAFESSAVEDIDRDGNYDIAFATYDKDYPNDYHIGLHVLGSWGGILPGFPVLFYRPPGVSWGENYASPTTGDFDDDGIMELVVTNDGGELILIRADGSYYRNWPVVFYAGGAFHINPPSLGDVDNDGKLEISTTDSSYLHSLFVFNDDASIIDGFPVDYSPFHDIRVAYRSPSLADINEDGSLELFVLVSCIGLNAFRNDGSNLPGWPIFLEINGYPVSFNSFSSIGDIDGDGQMEVIAAGGTCAGCSDGVIAAYNYDGSMVNGFPIIEDRYGFIGVGANLADLDNDGDIEICTASERCDIQSELPAYVYCYDLPYPYVESKIAWNNYAHDPQHTGRYVNPTISLPIVTYVKPNSAPFTGNKPVMIKGENFMQGAKVFFDGIPATNVQVADSTTIYATIPPHKPCYMYINDITVSPYELSLSLANQLVKSSSLELEAINSKFKIQNSKLNQNGCIVNVVVVHPTPDQREGILRGGFTYTGYEYPKNDVTLFVSKYSPMGTFENRGANWTWMSPHGLWGILDDSSQCVPKPYPSGNLIAYYGNKALCNYQSSERNYADLEAPPIKVDSPDAKIRFHYFRDVEYNTSRNADRFRVTVSDDGPWGPRTTIFQIDSTTPSQDQWTQSPDLSIGQYAGKELWVFFEFDSVDTTDNDHKGIAIDNIELMGAHWSGWAETSGEVILDWTGGLPKYFVYRGTNPDFSNNPPELRAYTPFTHKYENSLNDDQSYYFKVR